VGGADDGRSRRCDWDSCVGGSPGSPGFGGGCGWVPGTEGAATAAGDVDCEGGAIVWSPLGRGRLDGGGAYYRCVRRTSFCRGRY